MTHAILTAIGADHPGLVEEVSQFIFDRGGNIEDSRMVNLRGQFAMMLLLSGDDAVLGVLRGEMEALSRESGLRAELHPANAARPMTLVGAMPYRLTGTGIDQPGLVHRIASLLREMNVNIESLDTRLVAAPVTGAPIFEMELILAVPQTSQLSVLRQRVGTLCDELNIDWELHPMS